jgi:AcrR family transcriptional regulator
MIPTSTAPSKIISPDQRREMIVSNARDAFMTRGYGATSMSAIAAKLGGSKTTLWSYFPSKPELFAAVADDLVSRYGKALEVRLDPHADIAAELSRFARALLHTLHTPAIIDMHRLVIGEAGRFPELGAMLYERGAARGKGRLAAFFETCMDMGKLRRGDGARAADHLASMVQMGSVQRRLLGLADRPAEDDLDREADDAVATFLYGWAI